MKGRVLVLDEIGGRQAAALMVDGRLEELAIDPADDVAIPGAIYRAVADRPVKWQGGVFVKLPDGSGFVRQVCGVAPVQLTPSFSMPGLVRNVCVKNVSI